MNRLAHYRELRGWSAAKLAQAAGVTRQTVYAIEAGTFTPNTAVALRLGKLLGATVEELFAEEEAPEERPAALLDHVPEGGLARIAQVGEKLVAAPPLHFEWPSADGTLTGRAVRLFSGEVPERVVIAGCDPAISILKQRQGIDLMNVNCSSTRALELMQQKLVHVAGSHLGDDALPRKRVRIVTFAVWEQGLAVAAGNPKKITGAAELARSGVSIINREPGAGARILLDRELAKAGVAPKQVSGYDRPASGHLETAWYVASGIADACITTRAAAHVFGLDFIPLSTERYDLVIPNAFLNWRPVERMLDALASASVRRELAALAGYDTSATGRAVDTSL